MEIELSGQEELAKLMAKKDTWLPPSGIVRYLGLVLKNLATSRFKDMYRELDPRDIHSALKISVHSCLRDDVLDMQKLIETSTIAAELFLRTSPGDCEQATLQSMMQQVRMIETQEVPVVPGLHMTKSQGDDAKLVGVGDEKQGDQVTGPKEEVEPDELVLDGTPEVEAENSNCLIGIKCPKCESLGPFRIASLCSAEVHDDGIESSTNYEWDETSACSCLQCHENGKVEDFMEKEEDEKEDEKEEAKPDEPEVKAEDTEKPAEETETEAQPGPGPAPLHPIIPMPKRCISLPKPKLVKLVKKKRSRVLG